MAASSPLNFRGSESADQIKTASPAFGQFVAYEVQRELWNFPNLLDTGAADNAQSMGTGAAEFAELNTSEIGGIYCDTSTDSYGTLWVLPAEIDVSKDIKFRVLWSNSEAAATGSCTWAVKYTPLTAGTTAFAIGATALGTAITAQADLAANVQQWSPLGVLAGGTLTNTPGDDSLTLTTICTLTTIANATALALQVHYSRRYVG